MRFRPQASPCRGFTLLEMITVLVMFAALGSIGATMMGKGFQIFFIGQESTENDWQGRLAFERIVRDFRKVRTPAAVDLTVMTAGTINFINTDSDIIYYTLSGTTLMRKLNAGPSQVLADNVSAFTISYLKNDGLTTAAVAADVYYITVQLTISSAHASMTYRSTVKPTNF